MKKLMIIVSLIVIVGISGAEPVLAIGIDFSHLKLVGNQLSAEVVVTDLKGEIVSAYDLAVGYNSRLLSAEDVEFSGALGDLSAYEVLQEDDLSTDGLVKFSELSFLSDSDLFILQGGDDVLLATLFFTIKLDRTLTFFESKWVVSLLGLEFLWAPENEVIGRNDTKILPPSVPETATIFLFGIGLAGLAGFGKRRARKS
jgi:hypothetical protein